MTIAAPRHSSSRGVGADRAGLVNPFPLRYPDSASPPMMTRRAWWLVAINVLFPGSAQVVAGNRRLGRFGVGATLAAWILVVLTGVTSLLWPQALYTVATNPFALFAVQVLLVGYAILWVVLSLDTLRLVRLVKTKPRARFFIAALAVVLMVVTTGGAAYAAYMVNVARDTVASIFGQGGPTVPPSDGYYNILLLGADSGEGRDSMRFDSISVVSVNAETGALTITGIPRDTERLPFSEGPMRELYPNGHEGRVDASCGWSSAINQLNTELEVCRDGETIYPDAIANGSAPGIEATKDAAEGYLGIEIPYYVFLDMHGFAALIDALGGIDVTVEQRLPKGGGPSYEGQPAEEWAIGWIEAGPQHMDGDTAQWYTRSRYTTSDWDRMRRQRQLQEAILAQFTPANVLSRFEEIADAGTDVVRTDLPQSMLPFFLDLAVKAREQPVQTLELNLEGVGVDPENPDVAFVQDAVQQALHPPTPAPEE